MELSLNLDLELLKLQKELAQTILEITNIFFSLLKKTKILLKTTWLELLIHFGDTFFTLNPVRFSTLIVFCSKQVSTHYSH